MIKTDKPYRRRTLGNHPLKPETLMMSYGYDPKLSEGAVKCPLFQTSTFTFRSAEDGKAFFELAYGLRQQRPTEDPGLIYSRLNNPDLEILEDRLTLWDEAESGLVFASGMAAITTTLLSFLRPGDALVHSEPVYGGTEFLIRNVLPQFGIQHVGFPAGAEAEPDTVDAVLREAKACGRLAVIYLESPANPTNRLVDLGRWADVARTAGGDRRPLVIVDNTFLGPLWQRPLGHGADLVIYSLTKYVGGHSDVIAGAVLGTEAHVSVVRGMRTILGTMADAHTGWLLMRSLETLKVRMVRSTENARHVADFLVRHPKVAAVNYLGFLGEGDPQRAVYDRYCLAPGSTFSFEVAGGEGAAFRLLNALRLVKLAVSLGGNESLAEHPASMTHADVPREDQDALGISQGMVRVSIGIEDPDDLIADLSQALERV